MSSTIVSAISMGVSFITIIYLVGFWKGGVDTKLDTLWQVYVLDALHSKPNLATRNSPLNITQEGIEMIPERLRAMMAKWPVCNVRNGTMPSYEIVQCMGLPAIKSFAEKNNLTVQDTIALFSLYIKSLKTKNRGEQDNGKN